MWKWLFIWKLPSRREISGQKCSEMFWRLLKEDYKRTNVLELKDCKTLNASIIMTRLILIVIRSRDLRRLMNRLKGCVSVATELRLIVMCRAENIAARDITARESAKFVRRFIFCLCLTILLSHWPSLRPRPIDPRASQVILFACFRPRLLNCSHLRHADSITLT